MTESGPTAPEHRPVGPAEEAGWVVWITGRPSAGKSTLSSLLAAVLRGRGRACAVLDGDAVRAAVVPAHDYTAAGRADFYETLARLAAELARQGLVVLVPATAHRRAFRARAKELAARYVEVFVDVPVEEARRRDAKGLYAALEERRVSDLPGADTPYEAPSHADVVARDGRDDAAVAAVVALLSGGGA